MKMFTIVPQSIYSRSNIVKAKQLFTGILTSNKFFPNVRKKTIYYALFSNIVLIVILSNVRPTFNIWFILKSLVNLYHKEEANNFLNYIFSIGLYFDKTI